MLSFTYASTVVMAQFSTMCALHPKLGIGGVWVICRVWLIPLQIKHDVSTVDGHATDQQRPQVGRDQG